MKKLVVLSLMLVLSWSSITAQNDIIRNSVKPSVEQIYNTVLPLLEQIEIAGSSETSSELRSRWNNVINYFRNNKDGLAEQVKDLLVTPSGKNIDMDLVRQFIDINNKDSITKITINPDFWINELQVLSNKLTEAAEKMAKQK